jgi:hypothetical protein
MQNTNNEITKLFAISKNKLSGNEYSSKAKELTFSIIS